MTPHAFLFTIAAIGISETMYLIQSRRLEQGPICLIGSTCKEVLDSRYNKIFGAHNDVLGLLYYIGIGLLTAFIVIGVRISFVDIELVVTTLIGVGVVMSGIFTFIQWKVIRAWCFWCLMSALTTILMAGIVLISNLHIV